MADNALLISARPEDEQFAEAACAGAGINLEVCETAEDGAAMIASMEPKIILVDVSTEEQYQQIEAAIQETVGIFSDKINANAIHFLTSEPIEKVPYLIQSPLFGHYVMRNFQEARVAGGQYGFVLRATLAERGFGLQGLLKPGAKIQVVKLQKSTQKQDAVEAVKNYFMAAKFQTRMATVIANAVDELLMNAMFDAPVDELGRPLYAATPRNTVLNLEGKSAVEMHVGYDGTYAAISAVDYYGSLDKLTLLAHVSKIYTDEEYKIRTSQAGAGIGLATVFRSGGSLLFMSESRTRTEATVFFRKTDSFREFKDQFRFLSTQFYF